jgi:hypothetical protein
VHTTTSVWCPELLGLIASSLIGLEDYTTAEAVLGEAAETARRTLGPSHPWTLHLRARLADTHRYLGKTEVMRKELDELLPELRRNPRAFPDDLASAIGSAAHLAIDEGRYEEAQVGPARIFVKHTIDVRSYRGAYFGEAGLVSSHALGRDVTLAAALSVGWASERFNQAYLGVAKRAVNVVAAEVALSYAPSERFQLRPHVSLTQVPDRQLSRALAEPRIFNFGGGINIRPRRSP